MFRKSFALVALTLCAATAFAMPKPSEVNAAFANKDYPRAESMLKEVLAAKDSPKAHWQLGQVYSAEGKHQQALAEMKQAAHDDPTFKFASNAAAGVRIMSNEQALAAPPAVVVQSPIAIPQGYAMVQQNAPTSPAVQQREESGGHTGLIIFLILLAVGGGIAYFVLAGKKKETVDASKELTDKKNQLLDLSKRLEDSILITKTAGFNVSDTQTILTRITGLQQSVRQSLADIKDGKAPTNNYLATLADKVDDVCTQSQEGIKAVSPVTTPPAPDWVSPASQDTVAPTAPYRQTPNTYGPPVVNSPAPAPQVIHHYHNPAPAPVVVQNSGSDFTSGLILGEMLSQPRERVVERTVYVEERAPAPAPRYVPEPAPAPYYAPPAQLDSSDDDNSYTPPPPPAMDSSSNDSWDSGSSSSGSSGGGDDSY